MLGIAIHGHRPVFCICKALCALTFISIISMAFYIKSIEMEWKGSLFLTTGKSSRQGYGKLNLRL